MPHALQHTDPAWQDDPHAEDGPGESKYVWHGHMRVVSAKRARTLRKRGVCLLPLHAVLDQSCGAHAPGCVEPTTPGNGPGKRSARYGWFVEDNNPTHAVHQFLKRRTRAKFRRAERLREMFRAQLADPHVLGLVITPFIHALDARPRRHWQDEPLRIEWGSVANAAEGIEKGYGVLPISGWNEFGIDRIDYATRIVADAIGVPERYLTGEGLPDVTPEEDAAARIYFAARDIHKHPDETDAEYKARAMRTTEVEFVTPGPEHQHMLARCVRCGSSMRTTLLGTRVCPACDG